MSVRLLNIARTSLFAQRAALEVVGHNVANVETAGYVRQRPVFSAIPGAVTGEAGGGVELVDIWLLRDALLATQVRGETGTLGQERAVRQSLLQVEQLFTDVTHGGLALRIEEMFDAWSNLGLDPTSATSRSLVVERSRLAADTIASRWQSLADLRSELDLRLNDMVDRANALAREVAQINREISATRSVAARNDLETRRDGVIRELAELCGAETIEQEGGVVDIVIGGRRLVEHTHLTPLELVADPAQPGMHLVALGGELSPAGLRGEIAGRLQVRDALIPGYMAHLDTLARTLADEINALHATGQDLAGNPGTDLFTYDAARPAATLDVSDAIIGDLSLIAAAKTDVVESDGTNALAINDLRNTRVLSGGTATLSQFAAELIATIGLDAQTAQTRLDSRRLLLQSLEDAYANQAGVSLDEEALELIRYQQAYTAASRLVSVALETMDAIFELR
ncbi:MAG: flagellar hook-associated protein FlgK [Armatimonadota bacterium]|jgi:flagellar hook-associated protein 1 FlgK